MKTQSAKALLERAKELGARLEDHKKQVTEAEEKDVGIVARGNYMDGGASAQMARSSMNSDEQRAMRTFGAGDVARLMEVDTSHPKYDKVDPHLKHVVVDLKRTVDVARWMSHLYQGERPDMFEDGDNIAKLKTIATHRYGREVLMPKIKAFTTTGVNAGAEWLQRLSSSNFIGEYMLEHVLESRFQTMPMPSSPYDLPVQDSLGKARLIAENTQLPEDTWSTSKMTMSAQKFGLHFVLSEEVTQDTAPDILAAARDQLIVGHDRAVESAIINGDNDGTHIDSDTQAAPATVAEKAWSGLRREALANSANGGTMDFGNAAVTLANFVATSTKMKRFGITPSDQAIIIGPSVRGQFLKIPELLTVDKFGANATILKGTIGSLMGIPIIVSEWMREDLNASGVYDGVTTNRAGILIVNLRRWWIGIRQPIRVKVATDLPYHDRILMASYQRKAFKGMPQDASEVSVVYGVNIAV